MIFESEGIQLGTIVFFKYSAHKGYVPAIVETIYPVIENETKPDLAVVIFVTGYHSGSEPKNRVKHGSKDFQWLTLLEIKKLEQEKEEALLRSEKEKLQPIAQPEQEKEAEPVGSKQGHRRKPAS